MYNILLIVQILVAIGIIGLVLVQHGKGADAGAAFGGGASGSVFGARGAGNFLSRTTAILALVFFLNSMGLAWLVSHRGGQGEGSVVDSLVEPAKPAKEESPASAAPGDVPDAPDAGLPQAESADDEPSATEQDVPEADLPVATESGSNAVEGGAGESAATASPSVDEVGVKAAPEVKADDAADSGKSK